MHHRLIGLVLRDRDSDLTLIHRVLVEHAAVYWKGYAATLVLMGITAACTAAVAYLIANVIQAVYVQRDILALLALCVALVALLSARGLAAYGQAVLLAWVGNRITADNQRRMFGKVVQEEVGYFADRHSSHFMASLLYGASSVTIVLNVLFLVLGRDLMSLIGLCTVMVLQDPTMSLIGVLTLPPAVLGVRHLVK